MNTFLLLFKKYEVLFTLPWVCLPMGHGSAHRSLQNTCPVPVRGLPPRLSTVTSRTLAVAPPTLAPLLCRSARRSTASLAPPAALHRPARPSSSSSVSRHSLRAPPPARALDGATRPGRCTLASPRPPADPRARLGRHLPRRPRSTARRRCRGRTLPFPSTGARTLDGATPPLLPGQDGSLLFARRPARALSPAALHAPLPLLG